VALRAIKSCALRQFITVSYALFGHHNNLIFTAQQQQYLFANSRTPEKATAHQNLYRVAPKKVSHRKQSILDNVRQAIPTESNGCNKYHM